MIYCDAHCHLGSRQFDEDRDQMIKRMLEADVSKAIIICCSRHDLDIGKKLKEKHPSFKLACSIHPQDLEDHDPKRLIEIRERIIESGADMVGEIGLDYYSHPHTREYQKDFFKAQLEMAREFDLPIDVHCRKADGDMLEILKASKNRGIIHSFSGSVEMMRLYLKLGYYISFGASVLFKGAKRPLQVVEAMPIDRLLIETDAPYQSPIKDHRHEPCDITAIYEKIAEIKQMPLPNLCEAVEKNFDIVFAKR